MVMAITLQAPRRARPLSRHGRQRYAVRVLHTLPRITRGGKSGYFLPNEALSNLVEDLEALSSPRYLASIRRARKDITAGRVYTLAEVKRELGMT